MSDYRTHLNRQLGFLRRSCAAYDSGYTDEAVRIATTIRVLAHNTRSSTSLLKHLNATTINLISSCEEPCEGTLFYIGLGVQTSSENDGKASFTYRPLLDGPYSRPVPFSKWWNMTVYILGGGHDLTRKSLILAAANKDGGAHVDSTLTPEYEALAKDGATGTLSYKLGEVSGEIPAIEAHFVGIRQIAHELLQSQDLLALS